MTAGAASSSARSFVSAMKTSRMTGSSSTAPPASRQISTCSRISAIPCRGEGISTPPRPAARASERGPESPYQMGSGVWIGFGVTIVSGTWKNRPSKLNDSCVQAPWQRSSASQKRATRSSRGTPCAANSSDT